MIMKTTWLIFLIFSMLIIVAPSFAQAPIDKVFQLNVSSNANNELLFTWTPFAVSDDIKVFRRAQNSKQWGSALVSLAGNVRDFKVACSEKMRYEYKFEKTGSIVSHSFVSGGFKIPAVHYRGVLMLLIDSAYTVDLKNEISTFILDLEGEGYQVLRKDINRNRPPKSVKKFITDSYVLYPKLTTVILLGHIPVPYSGSIYPDGHADHQGAWPCDAYYGDMDENGWTDEIVNNIAGSRPENKNVPGDGKFDPSVFPSEVELQVGRIDFFNLPAFSLSDKDLMKRYLLKNHQYRHGLVSIENQAIINDNFGYFDGEAFSSSGYRNFFSLMGTENTSLSPILNLSNSSALWAYGCGAGSYNSATGIATTSDFATKKFAAVFTMLFGSYFGDFDSQDNFMRAALASDGNILTTCWAGRPHWFFHTMALGEPIGVSTVMSQNNTSDYFSSNSANRIHIALLGDPTLKMYVIPSVNKVASIATNLNCSIIWQSSDVNIDAYTVYKFNSSLNRFVLIDSVAANQNSVIDNSPVSGVNKYMVRALRLEKVNSGSFYNMSQGVFTEVIFPSSNVPLAASIKLVTENNSVSITNDDGLLLCNFQINPVNALQMADFKVKNISGMASINANGLLKAIDNGLVRVFVITLDGSNISDSLDVLLSNQINLMQSISITSENNLDSVPINGTLQMNALILPEYATSKLIEWRITPQGGTGSISTNGLLTGKTAGNILVRLSAKDGSLLTSSKTIKVYKSTTKILNSEYAISFYPNPVKDKLYFNLSSNVENYSYSIFSAEGKFIVSNEQELREISFSAFPSGLYILKIRIQNQDLFVKVMKE